MRAHSVRWFVLAALALPTGMAFAQSNTPDRGITVVPAEPLPEKPPEPVLPAIQRVTQAVSL